MSNNNKNSVACWQCGGGGGGCGVSDLCHEVIANRLMSTMCRLHSFLLLLVLISLLLQGRLGFTRIHGGGEQTQTERYYGGVQRRWSVGKYFYNKKIK